MSKAETTAHEIIAHKEYEIPANSRIDRPRFVLTELWTSLTGSEFKRPSLQKALPNRQNDDDQNDDDKQLALMITASEQRCIAK